MFDLFNVLFPIIFLLIFIMIIVNFAKGITTWSKNNHSPRLTVFAKVVAKRQNTTYNQQAIAGDPTGAHWIPYNLIHDVLCDVSSRKWRSNGVCCIRYGVWRTC